MLDVKQSAGTFGELQSDNANYENEIWQNGVWFRRQLSEWKPLDTYSPHFYSVNSFFSGGGEDHYSFIFNFGYYNMITFLPSLSFLQTLYASYASL